jgi:hypothetical protein
MEGHDVRVYVLESTGHYGMSENCETSHTCTVYSILWRMYTKNETGQMPTVSAAKFNLKKKLCTSTSRLRVKEYYSLPSIRVYWYCTYIY